MKPYNFSLTGECRAFGKYRRTMVFLTLFALFFANGLSAQGGCTGISYSFEHYEPCKFRARYDNASECFIEIRYILESGEFASWDVNAGAGFTVEVISPSELWIHHNGGFMPLGSQVPLLFTLPPDLNTTMHIAYLDDCAQLGCEIFGGIPIESCPDLQDASIIGVKYRECGGLPYSNQTVIPDWTVQLLNVDGNVIAEQVTDAGGAYAFYDLPLGQYIVREAVIPGWTPKVPASGEYLVDLPPSQQAVRNFGNCPTCSCDDIYMDVVQRPDTSSGSCAYTFSVDNTGAYCFSGFNISIESDTFASIIPSPGWTVVEIDCQHFTLDPPNDYLFSGHIEPCLWRVVGGDNHNITVSTSWINSGVPVNCTRVFSYPCPPPSSPPPCCPVGSTFGNELVLNGNFQLGNQDFTNDYTYFSPGGPTMIGKYSVLNQGQIFPANSQWACSDHTLLGGNMLIVDGYGGPIAWQQTVNVTAGATYAYSAWFNNLVRPPKNYDDPQMTLFVDNTQIAGPLILPETPDQWVRLCGTWTAMASGTVTLSIRMLATTSIGNDVAIDDISFRACIPPLPCSVSISANPTPFCGSGTLTAIPTGLGPFSYQWSHGQNTQTINVQGLPCGTVCSVSVTCADGTMSSASYTVSDNVPPVAVCNLGVGVDLGSACTYLVTPAFVDGGSTDNCQIQSMSVSPAVLPPCAVTTVTLTVTDWCNNTSTCTMGIQTGEGVPPIMTCPANISINGTVGPNGLCTATFNPVPPVAIDNCDPSVTVTHNAPAVLQQGPNIITWTATDDCGNETTCTQIVTVQCNCDCPNNLVTNGSFENGTAGFPNALNQINQCSGWYAANNSPAANNVGDWYSYPSFPGFYFNVTNTPLPAHCGEKYAGFFLNTCEGITTQLSQTIQQGCSYEVGFWWTPAVTPTAPFSFFAVMSGGNCTMYHPSGSCSHSCNGDQHVVVNATTSHQAGTWYYHSMTITNAYPNVGFMTFTAAQGAPNVNNYIFVDDVCVKKIAEPCSVTAGLECFPPIDPTAYSALATLGCGSVVTQVDFYFDGNGPNPSSTNLISVVHPFNTLGIHTVCVVVTASNDGGHTFCRDTFCKEIETLHVPPTKCDSVEVFWQKLHTPEEFCCYSLQIDNMVPNCFNQIELTLSSGTFANASVTLGWNVIGPLTGNHIYLTPTAGGFIPTGFFSPIAICQPGGSNPHVLDVNLLSGLPPTVDTCHWDFEFDCFDSPTDSCCLDYDLFCQNVMNAVQVMVDNANCKATLNIGAMPPCDYLEWINWGDGTISNGPFVAGDMPMHTYAQSGAYVIQYLAIEVNPHTGLICFEKVLTETIVVECNPCPDCPNNLVQNPGFSQGAISGNLGGPGASNNWTVASGTPQVATSIACCDPVVMQMWGNRDLGEAICQTGFAFDPAKTYSISFSAQFFPQTGLPTPYVRFGFTAANSCVNPFTCTSNCEVIGQTGQITSQSCATYTLPNWTPTANWTNLIIRAFNNVPNVTGDPTTISWGRIDNICIQEVEDSCCADSITFNNLLAQGFTVAQQNCKITVTAPQFDSCYFFATPPYIVGGPPVPQVVVPATGSWMFNFTQNGTYTICVNVFDDCNFKLMCTTVTVDCDTCYCGSFSQVFARPTVGAPSIPLMCGGSYNFPCPAPGQSIPITGKFECQGNNCPSTSQINWTLIQPSGMTVSGTVQSDPYFFFPIMPLQYAQVGTYTLILKGNCGGTDCPPCIIKFTVDCPNPCPCDVQQFQKDVAKGFATALWGTSCQGCFSPIALNDCDMVEWKINGGPVLAMTNGSQSFCHVFSGAGTYSVTMIVSRKKSDGSPCETFVFSKTVTVTCILKDPCDDSVFPNPGFSEGAMAGGLNSGGASTGWKGLYGNPQVLEGQPAGTQDGWAILLTGHIDAADVMSSESAMCLVKGSGTFSARYGIKEKGLPGSSHDARLAVFLNRGDSYVFNVFDPESCFRIATLDITAYDTSWFDLEIPFNLSDWAALDSCGDAPHGVLVKPILYVFTCFESGVGGDLTRNELAVDQICFDNQLVSVKDPLEFGPLRIFPNPNPGTFTVELPEAAESGMIFRITDLAGRLVQEQKTEPGSAQQIVRAGALPAGLYFLQVVSDGKVLAVEKFVKQ